MDHNGPLRKEVLLALVEKTGGFDALETTEPASNPKTKEQAGTYDRMTKRHAPREGPVIARIVGSPRAHDLGKEVARWEERFRAK
ncbi:hypothetical protein IMZ48_46070 [Candidatus Bathyarchaeota archaeon]|nr:hypothetical protein [Candidatus Bathyarchaeota archaeon]